MHLLNPQGTCTAEDLLTMPDGDQYELVDGKLVETDMGTESSFVTTAAGMLQNAGLIEYRRGRIRVLDRAGLEDAACECYRVVRREFDRLLGTNGHRR